MTTCDTIVIGAGITGLTCAFQLKQKGVDVLILEKQNRIGGQIKTITDGPFTFETGPNTGVVKHPEVAELFEQLGNTCKLETALESSKKRLIWKNGQFHQLPAGLISAIGTPLFTWHDKFRILGEPWRAKGTDPNESIGSLAERRLGKSYVDYAVDPFLSGVYAGNPYQLSARCAMPKLYQLEQQYGSFIRGAIAKAKQPKTPRDKKATKKVFSAEGGFSKLTEAITNAIGLQKIITSVENISIAPTTDNGWNISANIEGVKAEFKCNKIVTTCGSYELPNILPFVDAQTMHKLNNLTYAPVVQVGVGISNTNGNNWLAFGGLVPSKEKQNILGVLFPSACFKNRAPHNGALMSFFIGGMRHPEMLNLTDEELTEIVNNNLSKMLKYPQPTVADAICISRHQRAIPQYEHTTDNRLEAIAKVQAQYPTLHIAGNLRDGIGMGDRIKQAFDVANELSKK